MSRDELIALFKENIKERQEKTQPKKRLSSKQEIFEMYMDKIEKDGLIDADILISELEKTGVFSRIQVRNYFDKMYNAGQIYQPKPGYFKRM